MPPTPTGMTMAIMPRTLTANEVLSRAAWTSASRRASIIVLERLDRGQDRLLVLVVLGVEEQLARAQQLLLVRQGALQATQLVGGHGRRHRAGAGERALPFESEPHGPDLGVGHRLGLLLALDEQVKLLLGRLQLGQPVHDPLARLRLLDLAPVVVQRRFVVVDDELPRVVGEAHRHVREVDAHLAGFGLPANGVLLSLDRAADEVDASPEKGGQDEKHTGGGDADRRLLHGHREPEPPCHQAAN